MTQGRRRSSTTSSSSVDSFSSAASAASNMSAEEIDNFRSMRGNPGQNVHELSHHMVGDMDEVNERLFDIDECREIEKRFIDTTGEPYSILVTTSEVRLCHVDDSGCYHYFHFDSYRTDNHHSGSTPAKQYWHVIDNEALGHIFVDISPSWVTVFHQDGVWECRRSQARIHETRDTVYDSRLGGFGQRKRRRAQLFKLYDNDDGGASGAHKPELLLASNTPGEKGDYHRAYKSFYHDL